MALDTSTVSCTIGVYESVPDFGFEHLHLRPAPVGAAAGAEESRGCYNLSLLE